MSQEFNKWLEVADYYGDFSEINCKKLLDKAEEFIEEAKDILNK